MNIFWKKFLFALIISTGVGMAVENTAVGLAVFAVLSIAVWTPIYINYAHDNPERLWFKRKLFGWGWSPVTWQGWLDVWVYIASAVFFGSTIDRNSSTREIVFTFILPLFVLTMLLVRICYRKGEKSRWQWGKDVNKYQ